MPVPQRSRPRQWRWWSAVAVGEWVRLLAFLLLILLALALLAPAALTSMAGALPEMLNRAAHAERSAASAIFKLPRTGLAFLSLLFIALITALSTALLRPLSVGQTGFRLLLDRIVQLIALALLLPLLAYVFNASLDPAHKAKAGDITTVAATILVVALFLGGGPLLLSRLKKVGPLELFETGASALGNRLSELLERESNEITKILGEDSPKSAVSPIALEVARRGETLLLLFDALGQPETMTAKAKRNHRALLFYVGVVAMRRKDWATAWERLERLQRLLGESYDRNEVVYNLPFKLAYDLGMSYLGPVLDPQSAAEQELPYDPSDPRERSQLLRRALDSLSRAVKEDPYSRDALFYRAWVAFDLGMWDLAIESNEAVLKLNEGDAPAKYNLAIAWIRKGRLDRAFEQLRTITLADKEGRATLEEALEDPDLEPLRKHLSYGGRLRRTLLSALSGG